MPDDIIPETELELATPSLQGNAAEGLAVVGVGASAGGLEALMEMVRYLPKAIHATYVIVQHMSPSHKSLLTALLARETHLEVKDVVDGTIPEANIVYVSPPNSDIIYKKGALRLVKPSEHLAVPKPSVDRFLISLAEEIGPRAIGVVLSGTGTDGSYGVQAVRGADGVTIAQDGATAKYDGMPVSANETGFVDILLNPRQIGEQLADILSMPRDLVRVREDAATDDPLADLLQIVMARTRVDFREYKRTTIHRRLERRMVARNIPDIAEYTRHCRTNPAEVDALFKDFLISVTRFFRDKAEFATLLPYVDEISKSHHTNRVVRIWIAGCATGEEAYSVAMLMAEALGEEALRNDRLQIFATDIDNDALAKARVGRYPREAANDIPPHLFEKYVRQVDDMIEMAPELRKAILFSEHNLCQDPPFLNIDLICCRNLLIYFDSALQSKVLSRFHYSLDKEGVLFLGTAETISVSGELFRSRGNDKKFYRKRMITREAERARTNEFSGGIRTRPRRNPLENTIRDDGRSDLAMFEGLARAVGPNSILVSDDLRILRVFGDISRYFSLSEGMRLQLSAAMLRHPLNQDAHMLSSIALNRMEHRAGTAKRLSDGDEKMVRLDAYPINSSEGSDQLVLLAFTEIDEPKVGEFLLGTDSAESKERVLSLERELAFARDTLQKTVTELEASNDELLTLHEEMQSTNEELQATNGELETSNEELQSTNEELITVNEELQISSVELNAVSNEQDAILENVAAALLIIDSALQIVKASAEAVELFDMGGGFQRPHLSQIKTPDNFPPLTDICLEVIQSGRAITRDIMTPDCVYVMRCAPYSNNKGQVHGATITIARSSDASELQSLMLKESNQMLMHRTATGDILRISEQSSKIVGAQGAHALIGRNLLDVVGDSALPILREDRDFLDSGEHVRTTEQSVLMPNGTRRFLRMERFRYQSSADRPASIYSIATDVTAEREAKRELTAHNEQLMMVSDIAKIGYWMIDLETGTINWSQEVYDIHGLLPDEFTPDLGAGLSFYHRDDRGRVSELVDAAMKDGEAFEFSARIVRADGKIQPIHSSCRIILGEDGKPLHIVGVFSRE